MLRKYGLISVVAVLFWGCDLFSTREFRSKPSEIRSLSGLARKGDSISFLATESVWKTGATAPEKILSSRRLVFTLEGDSLDAGDTLKVLSLRIREDSSGVIVETDRRVVRFSSQGVVLAGTASGGGARYFPLKISASLSQPLGEIAAATATATFASAPANAADTASGLHASVEPDTASLLAIPGLLVEGWSEARAMGLFTVKREQEAIDTLVYGGRQEEAWVIHETVGQTVDAGSAPVSEGGVPISAGRYWYGASGLLRIEQTWNGFGWRDDNGAVPAKSADGGPAATELRRVVVRL